MSDSNNPPKPPPDDYSKTTPNIPVPKDDDYAGDWEKTNYNQKFSPQPPADDWGKTVANYNVPPQSSSDEPDFNRTYLPSPKGAQPPEWGITDQNIKLPQDDFGKQEDYANTRYNSGEETYGATTPYFRLPEAERAKYQNIPPTPTEQARQDEAEKKDGVPSWLWISGGLMTLFFFIVFGIFAVWYFFINNTGFNVIVKSAPPNSRVMVDGSEWGISDEDGTINLALKSGSTRKIEIGHPHYKCDAREVKGADGDTQELIANCSPVSIKADDKNLDCAVPPKLGEFEKAEKCANIALDKLPQPNFSAEDLVKALNIFIINFDSGKYDIPAERMAFLKRAAEFIQKLPASTVLEVGGHTDDVGTDAYNMNLSDNRAKAVKEALIKSGVRDSALQTKGYGETKPKTTNSTEDGKFHNRRIEYSVIKQ